MIWSVAFLNVDIKKTRWHDLVRSCVPLWTMACATHQWWSGSIFNQHIYKSIDMFDVICSVFFCQFCNVAKVAMIHVRIFSQIWLQYKYDIKNLKASFYNFGYILEPCINLTIFLYFLSNSSFWEYKKAFILAFLIFNIAFWLYTANKKRLIMWSFLWNKYQNYRNQSIPNMNKAKTKYKKTYLNLSPSIETMI
jgi:hypothetical protein